MVVHLLVFMLYVILSFPNVLWTLLCAGHGLLPLTHWRHLCFMSSISDGNLWSSFCPFVIIGVACVERNSHLILYPYSLFRFSWTLHLRPSFNSSNSFERQRANPILLFAQANWFTFQIYALLLLFQISTPILPSTATYVHIYVVYANNMAAGVSDPNIRQALPVSLRCSVLSMVLLGHGWRYAAVSWFQGRCTE